ncbi:hypothetical protein NGM99_20580 [Mesorhizobium sp. RP14(2022)]|uniref:DUF6894 domain-containing protein n=1 Tax=Mesorhizobium liriopis TaxID=2953882 RepID=A0ABT1CBJ2_9HYPH|nr:hypothetical protein [Mesorhizobium liriopis]MCO6052188.1 hypothetical protein [Mesorhizobium liriopis]
MPRFFFNMPGQFEDPDGASYKDLDAARNEAITSGREMVSERIRQGALIGHDKIEIADENGTLLETIRLRDLIWMD